MCSNAVHFQIFLWVFNLGVVIWHPLSQDLGIYDTICLSAVPRNLKEKVETRFGSRWLELNRSHRIFFSRLKCQNFLKRWLWWIWSESDWKLGFDEYGLAAWLGFYCCFLNVIGLTLVSMGSQVIFLNNYYKSKWSNWRIITGYYSFVPI